MTENVVLISGATGGLGKAFAAECASRGWDLFLTDLSQDKLNRLAEGLGRQFGVFIQTYPCDLTDPAARKSLWQYVDTHDLQIKMLINVAGLDYEGPFDQRHVTELNTIVRLNIESTVEMTRRALYHRTPAVPLYIINVSSLAAFYPMPVKAVYAASKRFLLDWSQALNQELREQQVVVTALCPAGIPTHPACVRAIEAQGLMGRITTMNAGDIAALTIDRALDGHSIVIPGVMNQILRLMGSMVPPRLVAALVNLRWQKSYATSQGNLHAAPSSVSTS